MFGLDCKRKITKKYVVETLMEKRKKEAKERGVSLKTIMDEKKEMKKRIMDERMGIYGKNSPVKKIATISKISNSITIDGIIENGFLIIKVGDSSKIIKAYLLEKGGKINYGGDFDKITNSEKTKVRKIANAFFKKLKKKEKDMK